MGSLIIPSNWAGSQPTPGKSVQKMGHEGIPGGQLIPTSALGHENPRDAAGRALGALRKPRVSRAVFPPSFPSAQVLYISQLSLSSPFTFSVPCNSERMYGSSSLEEKNEEWKSQGEQRHTLSQAAVAVPLCDLFAR